MAEYIEREELRKVFIRYLSAAHVQIGNSVGAGMRIAISSCIELLDNAPAADVVEVVRCCDCKHSREADMFGERTVLICGKTDYVKQPDGYCDEGRRRSDGK